MADEVITELRLWAAVQALQQLMDAVGEDDPRCQRARDELNYIAAVVDACGAIMAATISVFRACGNPNPVLLEVLAQLDKMMAPEGWDSFISFVDDFARKEAAKRPTAPIRNRNEWSPYL